VAGKTLLYSPFSAKQVRPSSSGRKQFRTRRAAKYQRAISSHNRTHRANVAGTRPARDLGTCHAAATRAVRSPRKDPSACGARSDGAAQFAMGRVGSYSALGDVVRHFVDDSRWKLDSWCRRTVSASSKPVWWLTVSTDGSSGWTFSARWDTSIIPSIRDPRSVPRSAILTIHDKNASNPACSMRVLTISA